MDELNGCNYGICTYIYICVCVVQSNIIYIYIV